MGKLISAIVAAGLAIWLGWIMVASDEAVRVERAASVCGGTAKVMGSIVRAFDESAGEAFYELHTSWSASCQASIWYFFSGADDRHATAPVDQIQMPTPPGGALPSDSAGKPLPNGKAGGGLPDMPRRSEPPASAHSGSGRPVGDERL